VDAGENVDNSGPRGLNENAQGHGGRHCLLLPQAMSIKNKDKGVLRVGVPLMQDLQEWAEQSQSSEDSKQLTLETF